MDERSTFRIARASRAVGPFRVGVDACPPRPSTRSTTLVVPFSVTPMAPTGGLMPGNASPAIAPPSSRTNHGRTPRRVSSATASVAAVPLTSSSDPRLSHTSWAGVKPRSTNRSTASQMATTQPLSSRVPRPHTAPSWISAENGGCCQGADSSTGTTSRWAISTTGLSVVRAGPAEEQAVAADAGELERGVEPREETRVLGEQRVERRRVDPLGVAVGDGRDAHQRLQLGHGPRRHGLTIGAAATWAQTRSATSSSRPLTPALR